MIGIPRRLFTEVDDKTKILVINSYHRGYKWSDEILDGIEDLLLKRRQDMHLYVEYMDTRHVYPNGYLDQLYDMYRYKFRSSSFDVVIVSDDNALKFMLQFHDDLFPETPVVFCGVNDFKASYFENTNWFTGVVENLDIRSTLNVALRLHPNTSQVFIITDMTTTGRVLDKKFKNEITPEYENRIRFTFFEGYDIQKLLEAIRKLPADSIVLFTLLTRDDRGRFFAYDEIISMLVAESNVPVYSFKDMYLGKGIVGGMLTSGYQQGSVAAELADRILQGENVHDIPIVHRNPNKYMFDYHELKRYNIRLRELPKGSIIINRPSPFYRVHKGLFFSIIGVFMIILFFVFSFFFNIKKRKKAELELVREHSKLESALKFEKLISEFASYLNSPGISARIIDERTLTRFINLRKIGGVIIYDSSSRSTQIFKAGSIGLDFEAGLRRAGAKKFFRTSSLIEKIKKNRYVILDDLSGLSDGDRFFFKDINIGSLIGCSLEVEKHSLGYILFYQNRPYRWSRDEIQLYRTLADMMANTLERHFQFNARLEMEKRNTQAVEILEESSRLASIGVMAAGITHEINQPLNAIKVLADSILYSNARNRDALPPTYVDKVRKITRGADRIDEIIKHMRTFWAVPTAALKNAVNINDVVKSSLSLIERQLSSHGIEPEISLAKEDVSIVANYVQCEQVIINLILNAMSSLDVSGKKDKELIIATMRRNDSVIIEVSDNGVGLLEGANNKIFDPFYSTKKPGEGMGLGLAIVDSIVRRFNGNVKGENNQKGGATFSVVFPYNEK